MAGMKITAGEGLCTAAGVPIAKGTVFADATQAVYALTLGGSNPAWEIDYTKGTEPGLNCKPLVRRNAQTTWRNATVVGGGTNAGTITGAGAEVNYLASTVTSNVKDGSLLFFKCSPAHVMAKLMLDAVAGGATWGTGTGTMTIGFCPDSKATFIS